MQVVGLNPFISAPKRIGLERKRAMRGVDIEVRGVSKRFQGRSGEAEALRDVSLDIRAGEFVALVGPSGCGKTTLLNMIAGLEPIDHGEIRVGGKKVKGPGPDRTVIFQEAALFPWLTVRANIEYGLRIQGATRAEREERVESALRSVQLSRFGDSLVHELSGGMRQRIAIARAMVLEPSVLLMDEPFSALDLRTRELLEREVEDAWTVDRPTVVFVSHHIKAAVLLADRVFAFGARPGRLLREIPIQLPRPRTSESAVVQRLTKELNATLRNEVDRNAVLELAAIDGGATENP